MGHLKIIIAEILAQGFRLVFTLSSDGAKAGGLDSEYVEKLTSGGNAIFPDWVTSWSCWITRATNRPTPSKSQNSMTGYELLQIRTGAAKNTAYTRGGDFTIHGTDEAV
ncbi:hypothetical protein FRC10_010218 [Ceratobasidium sp. 414]|nr:hypothetical protein FRC10_010218 [Ceratobasidium sp. 414]